MIESFYANEESTSRVFKDHLKRLKDKEGIRTEIVTSISDGGHIVFHSPELRHRLNSIYSYSFEQSKGFYGISDKETGLTIRYTDAYSSSELFDSDDLFAMLSYVAGSYLRYGDEDTLRLVNATHKVNLLVELLMELGCTEVKVEFSDPMSIPRVSKITFQPPDKVSEVLRNVTKEKENNPNQSTNTTPANDPR